MTETLTLELRRTIRASAERLFEAWTTPAMLRQWWGPPEVECSDAAVDLVVGGHYHLDNRLPDGTVLRIEGQFERIEPPHTLVYSWRLGAEAPAERVTVRFEARDGGTEVVVTHERIGSVAARDQHGRGWEGCLDGLVELLAA
ncbi:MAG: SRPBCC domain-containing protein [Deltaproteobacteria bacterium]|nr:SRPBCC domain-containing protein [Deltaproteobacteria bacterium]